MASDLFMKKKTDGKALAITRASNQNHKPLEKTAVAHGGPREPARPPSNNAGHPAQKLKPGRPGPLVFTVYRVIIMTVSYTHLTLPTKRIV